MTEADIELARLCYWVAAVLTLLFGTWAISNWWGPLRYLLIALAASLLFTPYFIEQPSLNPATPEARQENLVPALVVMIYDAANDRDDWQSAIKKAGRPIVIVACVTGAMALILAGFIGSRRRHAPKRANPYLPTDDTKPTGKTVRKKSKNPYLPDDFE